MNKSKGNGSRRSEPQKGRRYTAEQKQHALLLVAAGMKRTDVGKAVGATVETLRRWVDAAEATGTMPELPLGIAHATPGEVEVQSGHKTATASRAPAKVKKSSRGHGSAAQRCAKATVRGPSGAASKGARNRPKEPDAGPKPPAAKSQALVASRSPYAPKDPGQGLSQVEVDAILEQKEKHPSMGPAQIRAQLKRFKSWRLSNKVIARVLRANGYELVRRSNRPQGFEPVRFEAPRRNALWQADYTELRVGVDKLHLFVVLDDFSRFCVGHTLADAPSSEVAIEVLQRAIARHGVPEAVRTDRGGAFKAHEFTEELEAELIDHIVGRPYHPEGGGKVESLIGTVRRELWDVEQFADRREAERRLAEFIEHYNERRAHMGIDGLTPADRFFGRADRVLESINAISRKRNSAFERQSPAGAPFEELAEQRSGPTEVLRLVIVDDQIQLRFCGAQVSLGSLQTP